MRKTLGMGLLLMIAVSSAPAQEAGSAVYGSGGRTRKPAMNTGELAGATPSGQIQFVEASVLMNVQPNAFVAVFGYVLEGADAAAGNAAVNAKFAEFIKAVEPLGVKRNDIFIDYISQNRVFDYTENGNVITEKLSGFETKKNIAIRYTDRAMLEKLLAAAAKSGIFDLIEVDYLVNDLAGARARLFQEAVKTIKRKEAAYAEAFSVKLTPYALAAEKYDAFFPGEQYRGYQAYEAGATYNAYNRTVIRPRKVTTFYYEPLDAAEFDAVIDPIGVEPIVQLTLYLKMQYDLPRTVSK
jgi:uncharacterized protein YggE